MSIHPKNKGKVYIVGAGPGDPELITLKAVKALEKADIVVYDRLANPELLAHTSGSAEHVYVGKKPGKPSARQEQINNILIGEARAGKTVVRLKGGDPFVFGRGGEECLALKSQNIPYSLIPGISSALSVPAYGGIPVTHRAVSRSFTVITGHTIGKNNINQDWDALSKSDTLVILMGMRNLPVISKKLMDFGLPTSTPATVIERGSQPDQQTVTGTLATIAEKAAPLSSPGIIVIGKTAAMADELAWFPDTAKSGQEQEQEQLNTKQIAVSG